MSQPAERSGDSRDGGMDGDGSVLHIRDGAAYYQTEITFDPVDAIIDDSADLRLHTAEGAVYLRRDTAERSVDSAADL